MCECVCLWVGGCVRVCVFVCVFLTLAVIVVSQCLIVHSGGHQLFCLVFLF